jgi:hypothetical protein
MPGRNRTATRGPRSSRRRATGLVWSIALLFGYPLVHAEQRERFAVLQPPAFAHHITYFNRMEDENWTNDVANAQSWSWLKANVPLFECPDAEVQETYYFRWWSFRKHLVNTPAGYVFTEFLVPMRHAGDANTISCGVGHHLAEGRWLADQRYLDDYIRYWLRGNGGKPQPHFHRYSSWFAAAVYERYLVNGDGQFVSGLLDDLVTDYRSWEAERLLPSGLFWQYDVRDGMEESISGSRTNKNLRPTINTYMYGNALAIAAVSRLAQRPDLGREFDQKATELKRLANSALWNAPAQFFEVRDPDGRFADVREEIGFIPWVFGLADPACNVAWAQLTDPAGFHAAYGITTAERRSPAFRSHGCCRCEWDGAVWPFATSQTLEALGNVLRGGAAAPVTARDYWDAFLNYTRCQHFDGKPYIGEYLDETTGQWLKGRQERSRYYNHSTYADLVITGVVGLRPRADATVEVEPLLPAGLWDWFCLDGIPYHSRALTVIWDKDGKRYGRGQGLSILADGQVIAHVSQLAKLTGALPSK